MKKLVFSFLVSTGICSSLHAQCVTIGGEYLYWNILQPNMPYATLVDDITTFAHPKSILQKQEWASGFRLTAGIDLPCRFDVSASWTRFHTDFHGSTSQPTIVASQLIEPFNDALIIGGDGIGGTASSKWNLRFDMYDLNFGCLTFDSCLFAIHPKIGVKGGKIRQNQIVQYNNFFDTATDLSLDSTIELKNNLWGVGPKIGLDSAYKLGCGFSFVGDFSLALLYGNLSTSVTSVINEIGGAYIDSSFKEHNHLLQPNIQLFLGLNWDSAICKNFPVTIGVGYEVQYFWNTWHIRNSRRQDWISQDVGFSDLMFNGLTIKLFLGF